MPDGTLNLAAQGAPGGPREPRRTEMLKTVIFFSILHTDSRGWRLPACRLAPSTPQPREPQQGPGPTLENTNTRLGPSEGLGPPLAVSTFNPEEPQAGPQRGPRTPTDRLNHQFWRTPGWAPARA